MVNNLSVLSEAVIPILVMLSKFLDYFVSGDVMTLQGNLIVGAAAQITENIAKFLAVLSEVLY